MEAGDGRGQRDESLMTWLELLRDVYLHRSLVTSHNITHASAAAATSTGASLSQCIGLRAAYVTGTCSQPADALMSVYLSS